MSRAGRAVRAAHLQRLTRLWGDSTPALDTGVTSTQSCHQLSRLASNGTLSARCRGEALSDNLLHLGPQRRALSRASSELVVNSGSRCLREGQGCAFNTNFTRAFSQVFPEKEGEPGRTEESPVLEAISEEGLPKTAEAATEPTEDGKRLAAGLQESSAEKDADSDVSDDDEEVPEAGEAIPVAFDNNKNIDLWKKIEKVRKGSQKSVVPLIKEWVAEGNTLDKGNLISLIIKLKRRARYKQALEISDYMSQDSSYKWEHMDEIVRIDLKFKLRLFRSAEVMFDKAPPEFKTEGAYNTMLKNYSEHRMVKKAEALMAETKESGLYSSPFPFNQMLLLYKRTHSEDKIPAVLEEMKAANIPRDAYTYNIMMDARAGTGDLTGMEEIFEEMKADEKIKPDAATYGTLASAYIAAGQPQRAQECLKEMEFGEFPRSRTAYDILLAQYGVMGDVEGVERIWEKLKTAPVVSNRSYVVVIEAFGKLGKINRAEEIFKDLESRKGMVLTGQYNALLNVYAHHGMTEKAEEILTKMTNAGRKRTAVTYHNVIKGHLKSNRMDKALDAFKKVKADAVHGKTKLWLETLLAILEEFSKQGNIGSAEKHFQEIKKAYPKSNARTYNILLKSYANAKVPAGGFLQRMAADKVAPTPETLALLRESGMTV